MDRERRVEWERAQKLGEMERMKDRVHQRSLILERDAQQARSPSKDKGPYKGVPSEHRDYNYQLG
jgi:hypothetical protein